MSGPTPVVAESVDKFSTGQENYTKNSLDLNGCDIYNMTFNSPNFETILELKEGKLYSYYTDTLITDGSTIEDSESNTYTVFILNKSSIAISEFFRLRIVGTIAYIYTY